MSARQAWPGRPSFNGQLSELDDVRREVMRLFNSVAGGSAAEDATGVFPPLNVTQDEDNIYLRAEVPGINPNQLSISALRNRVALTGKREIQVEPDKVSYHRRERADGSFSRTLTLPMEVDTERVEARYRDGILTLTLPKAEAAKPRQIQVRA